MKKEPRAKLSRREGKNLFLKGARSYSEKAGVIRRPTKPGQHGAKPARLSEYGKQLREKQKVKRMYCLREKQFRRFYRKAEKIARNTGMDRGYLLLRLLEQRLDNVVYRSGLAKSRPMARQLINHKHIAVNGKAVDVPSYLLKEGDVVSLRKPDKLETFAADYEFAPPLWLGIKKHEVSVKTLPEREQIDMEIRENLVVELYSR